MKMAKSAAAYTKKAAYIGKKIAMCVKEGGPNPDGNRALALLMKEAKSMGVSSDVVARNIKKASEKPVDFKELTYEAYGLGGAGFIINCLSDNNNRANAQVNAVINKCDGFKMAASGSVLFNFERKARLTVNSPLEEEQLIEIAIDAGVDDAELQDPDPARGDGDQVKAVVITADTDLGNLREALEDAGMAVTGQLVNMPLVTVECSEEDLEANLAALDKIEELDDVDSVEHNLLLEGVEMEA